MKQAIWLSAAVLLFWTSVAFGSLSILSPEEMLSQAQIIVAGEVTEIRLDPAQPEFVLQVDTVYKGEQVLDRLVLPLPKMSGPQAAEKTAELAPPKGARLFLLLMVEEGRRLVPVAGLNWAAYLTGRRVTRLFLGASALEWQEEHYLAAYNRFLAEEPGRRSAGPAAGEPESAAATKQRPPGRALSALPLLLAGFLVLALVLGRKIRKAPVGQQKNKPDPRRDR